MHNTPKEWDRIKKIKQRVQRQSGHTVVGLGDDAFVFKNFPGYSVLCQDMMVEGNHFLKDSTTAFDLGHKALAVNLSDIAAMGARPHYIQVSLALPKNLNESWLDEFYQGMTILADKHGCEIIGGDLTSSEKIVIDVSVHGSCEHPLRRHGAKANDLLLSSGPLGLSHTGLLALQKNCPGFMAAKTRHHTPSPRLDLVAELQKHYEKVHALMDCSDGLVNDALQMCGVLGIELLQDQIPVHEETQQLAQQLQLSLEDFVLWGGEDYELLLAIDPSDRKYFPEWKVLGSFTSEPGFFILKGDKKEELKTFKGWRHF